MFSCSADGYDKIQYRKKYIHNQIGRQRQKQILKKEWTTKALKYLKKMATKDPLMFVRNIVDNEGQMQHLFWCNEESQLNFEVFGDVLSSF